MQPKWYFEKFAKPFLRNKEILSLKELNQINEFVTRLVPIKMKQTRFLKQNPDWVFNSFYNGYMSEIAIENYTGTKFIHWKIRDEKESDISDLSFLGLDLGVKTSEYGNVPLVYHYPKTPEIITIIEKPKTVYVIGYATKPMIKYYQSPNYVYGPVAKIKNGFWGFHKLFEFKTIDDLKKLYHNKNINEYDKFDDSVKDFPNNEKIVTFENFY